MFVNPVRTRKLWKIREDGVETVGFENFIVSAFTHLGRPFFVDKTSKILSEHGLFAAQLTQYFRGSKEDYLYEMSFHQQEEYISYGKRPVLLYISMLRPFSYFLIIYVKAMVSRLLCQGLPRNWILRIFP